MCVCVGVWVRVLELGCCASCRIHTIDFEALCCTERDAVTLEQEALDSY